MSKTGAYILTMIILLIISVIAMWWPDRGTHLPTIMTAIGGLTTFYIGLQVANNGVKGKCWNQEMYEAENKSKGT